MEVYFHCAVLFYLAMLDELFGVSSHHEASDRARTTTRGLPGRRCPPSSALTLTGWLVISWRPISAA
ncbi:hypothetical protein KEM60_02828 [Austwickia sp. TVS 96-490-7B]|nr:hypothetical protein [Austwickia sp. TVS 96-490-7B]